VLNWFVMLYQLTYELLLLLRVDYLSRIIIHNSFHNISTVECEKMMKSLDQGDLIVRPSPKVWESLVYLFNMYPLILTTLFSIGQCCMFQTSRETLSPFVKRYSKVIMMMMLYGILEFGTMQMFYSISLLIPVRLCRSVPCIVRVSLHMLERPI